MKLKKLLKNIGNTKILPINFIKRTLFLVKIEGESNWPELIPGKVYFATNLLKPKINEFIIFQKPTNKKEILVKKVNEIKNGKYFVKGVLPWTESSNDFGLVNREIILGKIIK